MEYIPAKSIVIRAKKPGHWFGIDYNMNIYKGCNHGCIYCDSRSECYGIKEFDKVKAKEDALRIIRDELRRKVKKGVVATGAMSDPYNSFEEELKLTRHALELLDAFDFGVSIATKSSLITRDIDILQSIQEHSPVLCKITITTSDDILAKKIEPGVPTSSERFEVVKALSKQGIFTGILLMPVLPFINDTEENVMSIVEQADQAGAKFIYPAFGVTLRDNQRDWYYQKLNELFPDDGYVEKYRNQFGDYYECRCRGAGKLYRMLEKECSQRGMYYKMADIVRAYKRGYEAKQMSIYDILTK